jgi:SAM-dependent MidA family methyltransferase
MSFSENQLMPLVRQEIEGTGPISLARFMQLALYHPVHGYYYQPAKQIGCQGDFYTSVSVGNLLGQLLGYHFAQELDAVLALCGNGLLHLVEGGAHDGLLARDIMSWLSAWRPSLFATTQYTILEPSPARQKVQAETLDAFSGRIVWVTNWDALPQAALRGVVFANELVDAFPLIRLAWDRRHACWLEWRVDWADDRLVWVPCPPDAAAESELSLPHWRELPGALLDVLPDGFTVEVAPAAREWWTAAAVRLREGSLLTLDYGLEWEERFNPGRANGTVRTYSQHRIGDDLLCCPGRQDITAHVDFSALIRAGEQAGLTTREYCSQSVFLTRIARRALADPSKFGNWSEAQTRQFQTLTHPTHFGSAFRALEQAR